MNRCDCLTALCGSILGILAFSFACTALSSRNWEIETHVDYFRSSSKYNQLHLSRIMSIFSLIFTFIGILASSYMIIKHFSKYWNLVAPGAYLLASFTLLLAMCEASRLIHHNGWPSHIYGTAFCLLLLATQVMVALSGKLIFSYK
ncbi:unnamed protein product [Rotaria socialis]|uniref:Uncharacterized protein n=2 Tax=Rotaria socialis TaxID=392032 RepID=A0A817VPT2_9BILA|nr:unnamed protein product [Rotaria socialis]CAF3562953.1 unnamed protein product [Rotaria socialis]CAF3653068.1 unnamed protein product [Rotaria socialis]CAF3686262.1 unnamed protein product [Rotaria socialis]CAF4554459.1 unnamed protein product [Rotaria socialis]